MTVKTNILIQIVMTLGQIVNQFAPMVPDKYAVVLAVVQAVVGVLAHYYNTDGTPQTKAFVKPLALVVLVLALTGCSSTNISELVDALAKDPATVCVNFVSMWGTVSAARTNIVSGDVTCDKLQVHSPGQTTLPVTVVPQTAQSPLPVQLVPSKP